MDKLIKEINEKVDTREKQINFFRVAYPDLINPGIAFLKLKNGERKTITFDEIDAIINVAGISIDKLFKKEENDWDYRSSIKSIRRI